MAAIPKIGARARYAILVWLLGTDDEYTHGVLRGVGGCGGFGQRGGRDRLHLRCDSEYPRATGLRRFEYDDRGVV